MMGYDLVIRKQINSSGMQKDEGTDRNNRNNQAGTIQPPIEAL